YAGARSTADRAVGRSPGIFLLATRCAREGASRAGSCYAFLAGQHQQIEQNSEGHHDHRQLVKMGPGGLKRGSLIFFQSLGPILPRARAGWGSLPLASRRSGRQRWGVERFQTGGLPLLTGRKWLSSKGKLALLFGFRTLGLTRLSKTLAGCNKPHRSARATKGHEPHHPLSD